MIVTNDVMGANADGFAFDGRSRKPTGATNHEYNGHQRLAEVIIYDRAVTDEERRKIESYLDCKWYNGRHPYADNVTVNVAANATLDLTAGASRFGALTGGGTVEGDIALVTLGADGMAASWPTVEGTLTFQPGQNVALCNIDPSANLAGRRIKILSATAFAELENMRDAVFGGGDVGNRVVPHLTVRGNDLEVLFTRAGTVINFK